MHLSERLAYEKAVHDQRMRTEISQAKRETNFYKNAVDKNRTLQRLQKTARVTPVGISQRKTTEEMLQGNSLEPGIDKELLQSIFGGE